jgi:RNA polymerase sigma-70 factor (ECF subfamily)
VTVLPAGDDQLLRQLYRDHAGLLLGYVTRLTGGDVAAAEDVVQETLLRAWRNPDALTGRADPQVRGWLVTVAKRIVIDGHRARQARPPESLGAVDREFDAVSVPADDERILVGLEVADALAALSSEHRAVITELYYRDASVADAAARLGIPEGTVKSRAYYALRALRVACQEREVML